jgi:hypothetical protein
MATTSIKGGEIRELDTGFVVASLVASLVADVSRYIIPAQGTVQTSEREL